MLIQAHTLPWLTSLHWSAYKGRSMRKLTFLIPLLLSLSSVCVQEPVFAEDEQDVPALTSAEVVKVMAALPPEGCLFNPHAKYCATPGGFDRGPDAKRIADAIVGAANGHVTGDRRLDAALMATYSSYESGNKADAVGDGGLAHGAWQLHYVPEEVAFQPSRAASIWIARAVETMNGPACSGNAPDERLAGLAGSCSYELARRRVRQRLAIARQMILSQIDGT
jgi:hypothetical protein